MTGIPYDDLTAWRGPYPAEVFAAQFEKVAAGWRSGIPDLKAAVEKAPPDRRDEAQAELRFAQAAYIQFPVGGQPDAFCACPRRLANPSNKLSPEERRRLRDEIKRCLESEIVSGPPAFHARPRGFADRLRGRQSVLLLAAGLGGKGGQLPLAAEPL